MKGQTSKKTEQNGPLESQKRMVVVQLTRIGDLIQTMSAVKQAKQTLPDLTLTLIARKSFASPIYNILKEVFDEIYLLDMAQILKGSGLKSFLLNQKQFLNLINQNPNDVVVNLTYSKASMYLASLIQSNHKIGPYKGLDNKTRIEDTWSQYVYSNVLSAPLTPFSLVDLFSKVIGTKNFNPPKVEDAKRINNIVLHPFASSDRKRWKDVKWVEYLYRLLSNNNDLTVNIVGSSLDRKMGMAIKSDPILQKFSHQIFVLAGSYSLEDVYELLKTAKLFVGHDSVVGHLASLAGTQALTLSLGTVRPYETTPYGDNNYVLFPRTKCFPCTPDQNCSFYQCHIDVPHNVVVECTKQILKTKNISIDELTKKCSDFHLKSLSIYKTDLSQTDLILRKIDTNYPNTMEIFQTLYRIAWQYFISEKEEEHTFPTIGKSNHTNLVNILTALQNLFELSEFGKKYSKYILQEVSTKTPDLTKIKEYSKKIDEIDNLQLMVKNSFPQLSPIIDYFNVVKANLKGENIVHLTESSYLNFSNTGMFSSIIYELIEKVLEKNKLRSENYSQKEV